MKISLNWINDYVDLKGVNPDELIKKIGLKTAEIEGVEYKGKDLKGVIVARIEKVLPHPSSEKLHILKVDTGSELVQVVCGAPNVKEGMKTAFAPVGSSVLGQQINVASIAGQTSYGMCCSMKELGISDDHSGIWEITDDLPLGTDITKAYEINDIIFEVDNKSLTNRPDLWSHYGFAREISAIINKPLRSMKIENLQYYGKKPNLKIEVNSENCFRYSGLKIGNITKHISPVGVQIRLYYCGMRAINLLADLTNYVMLEVGQPMHAFDGGLVKSIEVKDLVEDTDFTTLDNEKRVLPKGTCVICSNGEVSAVAGVMGGLDSEIKDNTNSVFLESACFDSASVRKTAIKLGLRTEASSRYEKSLDPEMTTTAINRFVFILKQIDPNILIESSLTDVYKKKYPVRTINITMPFINKYIGVDLDTTTVCNILTSLGFTTTVSGENIVVKVPSFRATKDVSIAVDLVEEVARMYGYDNIQPKNVIGALSPVEQQEEHLLEYDTKLLLAEKFNLNEIHSYIWNDVKANKELNIKTKGYIKVLNSTVKDNDEIRSELVPTLLKCLYENKKYEQEMGVFEIARVCSGVDENNLAIEDKHLAVALSSTKKSEEQLYFEVKDIIVSMASLLLNANATLKPMTNNIDYLHPVNNASVVIEGVKVGYISLLHPKVLQNFDKKQSIAVLEIDFNKFANLKQNKPVFNLTTKYQRVSIDFNFVVDKDMYYGEIKEIIDSFNPSVEMEYSLVDIYYDDQALLNKKSVTINFSIYSYDHTLTGDEINEFRTNILDYLKQKGLELRLN